MILKKDGLLLRYKSHWEKGTLCEARLPLEECDTLILGSIVRSLESSKPAAEYQRMSVLGLRDEISSFRLNFFPRYEQTCSNSGAARKRHYRLHTKCQCGSDCYSREGSHSDTCDPMPALLALIDDIISSVSGMDLEAERIPMKRPNWEAADIR